MAYQAPSGSSNSQPGSTTNLIVNYLPQTLTDQEFACIFQSVGPLKSSKIVRDKKSNYSYGFGFVDYEKAEDASQAIDTLNGLKLQNKTLKVAYARPCTEDTRGTNLYIRGLPHYMTDEHLRQTFQPYGGIVQARVLYDQFSGASKGIGFVLFGRRSESQAAMEALNGVILQGSFEPMSVQFAEDNSKKVRAPPQATISQVPSAWNRAPGSSSSSSVGSGIGPAAVAAAASGSSGFGPIRSQGNRFNQGNRYNPLGGGTSSNGGGTAFNGGGGAAFNGSVSAYSSQPQQQGGDPGGHVVFVYNIGYEADERALWELFAPYGTISKVNVIRDAQKGQCKGYGFVTMPDYTEALHAIGELNGRLYSGSRPLQVSFKTIGGGAAAASSSGGRGGNASGRQQGDMAGAATAGNFYGSAGGGGAGRAY